VIRAWPTGATGARQRSKIARNDEATAVHETLFDYTISDGRCFTPRSNAGALA
jgi:hypothetical protein